MRCRKSREEDFEMRLFVTFFVKLKYQLFIVLL
jgi:hypothetical protein